MDIENFQAHFIRMYRPKDLLIWFEHVHKNQHVPSICYELLFCETGRVHSRTHHHICSTSERIVVIILTAVFIISNKLTTFRVSNTIIHVFFLSNISPNCSSLKQIEIAASKTNKQRPACHSILDELQFIPSPSFFLSSSPSIFIPYLSLVHASFSIMILPNVCARCIAIKPTIR